MPNDLVLTSRKESIVTLRFNDPARRNALTQAMGEAFRDAVAGLMGDESVRAVVVTGSGKAFSAGGDLDMLEQRARRARSEDRREETHAFMRGFYSLFLSLRELECPTLAAINGHAIGAGLCVALACDFRYVAREAQLGLNFNRIGLHPGMGATWTLPRLVGPARAAELLYTSRIIDGETAAKIGLANRCMPGDEVLSATLATAMEIAVGAPRTIRATKRGLAHSEFADLEAQLEFEATAQAEDFENQDVQEGILAARERRTPRFKGQ